MKRRKAILLLSIGILGVAAYHVISGSPKLEAPLIDDPYLPWGTLITWAGLITLPVSIYLGFRRIYQPCRSRYRNLARALIVMIILAALWAPACSLLAGNLSFSFSEKAGFQGGQPAMRIFWIYSAALVVLPVLALVLFSVFRLLEYFSRPGKAD